MIKRKYINNDTLDKIADVCDNITAVAVFLVLWMGLSIISMYILAFIGLFGMAFYFNSFGIALIIEGYFLKNGNIQINSMY